MWLGRFDESEFSRWAQSANRRWALGSVSTLLLAGCSQGTIDDWKRAGYPAPSTEEGSTMLSLWTGSWIGPRGGHPGLGPDLLVDHRVPEA